MKNNKVACDSFMRQNFFYIALRPYPTAPVHSNQTIIILNGTDNEIAVFGVCLCENNNDSEIIPAMFDFIIFLFDFFLFCFFFP